jgi:hypothetical protein
MKRTSVVRAAVAVSVVAIAATFAIGAVADGGRHNENEFEYAIGLWGDLPYNDVQAQTGVPNLIADMNQQDLKFTVHDGDLKGGNGITGSVTPTRCDDALYDQGVKYLNALDRPAMFTPGDNDWTDCDRPANGGYNSRNRLDLERVKFFATSSSLGRRTMKQEVQPLSSTAFCLNEADAHVACVENRRWTVEDVTYVTVNFQGSCNNLCDTNPDPAEFAARNAANIAWLQDSFAKAKAKRSAAVMVIGQANPGFDGSDGTRAPVRDPKTLAETLPNPGALDGYQTFLVAFRDLVVDFKRPVVYVHGDSHYFRVDKPFLSATGQRLENFTRVETFGNNAANGNNDVHWIKVTVDPRSRDVFSFQAMMVPGNRTAVPVP